MLDEFLDKSGTNPVHFASMVMPYGIGQSLVSLLVDGGSYSYQS
jgi:hypothetical protein